MNETSSAALESLYLEQRSWLHGWFKRRIGCHWEAADLTHDAFLRLWKGRDLTQIREPRAYLTTVAHGLVVNRLQRRDIEQAYLAHLAALPATHAPDPAEQAQVIDALHRVFQLLAGLPERVRTAFLLAQLEGWTYARIAAHMGVSDSSVKQYLRRALSHCLALDADTA